MVGTVFDIKELAIHDGPGTRVTVFLKGCPLRCQWCHNPEGLSPEPQLSVKKTLCVGCGACRRTCDHPECQPFGRCLHACANGCVSIVGERITVDDLAEKLRAHTDLLAMLGGGITVSGGEPLLQAPFVCALAERLHGIHLALQTSGYARPEVYREVISHFDYVMQDIKLVDPTAHRHYTGVDNARILENVRYLMQSGKEYLFRIPLIPNITDTAENLTAIAALVGDAPVELLRYNPFAGAKYETVGMTYPLAEMQNREEDFTQYFKNATLS